MRILIVCPIPPDARGRGGLPRVLDAQVTGLRRHNEVAVLTVAGPEPHELAAVRRLAIEGVEVRALERREPAGTARWRRRTHFARLWLAGRLPWRSVWFWDPRTQGILNTLLTRERFDLVAVEDSAMAAYGYDGAVPTVYTEHEVRRPRRAQRPSGSVREVPRWVLGELDWRRWHPYQMRAWRSFDRVHVFTPRDGEIIRALAPDVTPRITPFGLRLPEPAEVGRERPDSVLMIGNFTHSPNVDAAEWLVREILPEIQRTRPKATAVIAGSQPPERILRLRSSCVEIVDGPDDLRPLVERAAVILSPVRIGGGMRVKSVEALAFGKPLVATPRGVAGFPACEGDEPFRLGTSATEFAKHTGELLRDADVRAHLGAAGRAYAERYLSAEAYATRLEASYREVLLERESRTEGLRERQTAALGPTSS